MDSPCSTKSRSSRKSNQQTFDLLKDELEKMSKDCNKYRKLYISLQDEVLILRKRNQELELKNLKSDKKCKKEIEKLNLVIKELEHKNKTSEKNVLQPSRTLSSSNKNIVINGNCFNDSTKQLINNSTKNWMQETTKVLNSRLLSEVEGAKKKFLINLEKEVNLILINLNLKKNHNEVDEEDFHRLNVNPEIKLVLKPLKNGFLELKKYFDNREQNIVDKLEELKNSQRMLEDSLNLEKIEDTIQNEKLSEYIDKVNSLQDENVQLANKNEDLLEENKFLKNSIDKLKDVNEKMKEDNKHLIQENESLSSEVENLDKDLKVLKIENSEFKKQADLNFENTLLFKIRKDYENLINDINDKFSELLHCLKDELSEFLSPNDKKILYNKITKFLKKFHNFAKEKIDQKNDVFKNYANMSISFLEPPSSERKLI